MQLALFNLAIDSKLRASDLLKLHVYDVSSQGVIYERIQCIQQKTGTDVHYEITPRTQKSISRWIYSASLEASSFLFPSGRRKGQPISYSFYRSIIRNWAVKLGLNADYYGTHLKWSTQAVKLAAWKRKITLPQSIPAWVISVKPKHSSVNSGQSSVCSQGTSAKHTIVWKSSRYVVAERKSPSSSRQFQSQYQSTGNLYHAYHDRLRIAMLL